MTKANKGGAAAPASRPPRGGANPAPATTPEPNATVDAAALDTTAPAPVPTPAPLAPPQTGEAIEGQPEGETTNGSEAQSEGQPEGSSGAQSEGQVEGAAQPQPGVPAEPAAAPKSKGKAVVVWVQPGHEIIGIGELLRMPADKAEQLRSAGRVRLASKEEAEAHRRFIKDVEAV